MSATLDALPQYTIMKLLQNLEARQNFDVIDPKAWLYVGVLLVSTVTSTLVNNRIIWFMVSELAVPVRSILTALLFEKMVKIKDCREPPKSEEKKVDEAPKSNGTSEANKQTPGVDKPKKVSRQTQHEIVNMFAVDANLVGVFCANSQFYVHFASKTIVSITFLWLLVGWQSLFAGLVAILVMIPINSFIAKRYKRNQKALMKARDAKITVITEALNGVRQIKFSAVEAQWMEKIYEAREVELGRLWQTMRNNIFMILASNIAPILLVAFALATYAYIHGDLLPSIAFTALGVFGQLEGVLGMTPFLLVMGLNAKISCDRIDSFLQSEESIENTHPGDSIVFDNVSVSFPSDSQQTRDDRFVLRNVSLEFPKHALSVISGPTGSGKSLLLAAILGEVELLAGNIRVPRSPPIAGRFNAKATDANWILSSAIAFVSQTPWIENATIKDNVLFGLPYDAVRYEKVLNACALTKDLKMFEDGDLTEVGAQGISLSGGQKWRLTLARAFYSRAGILILDDVFSAIDAHVGREIYDNALMGELSEGRTRILVTHHVSLCLPRAKYAVSLSSQGTLKHAGLVEELKKSGSFEEMLKAEQEENTSQATTDGDSSETTANGKTSGPAAKPVGSKDPKTIPKKLVDDEHRESGSVKKSVYMDYLKATGGLPFWTLVLIFYVIGQGLTLGRSWWIRAWTESYLQDESHITRIFHTYTTQTQLFAPSINSTTTLSVRSSQQGLGFYLGVYALISLVSIIFTTGRFYLVFRGSLRASRRVFREMTNRVFHTPLRWLDTEPTGRILNRFTADFQSMDSQLSSDVAQSCSSLIQVLGIMVAA
jgi:ABC-type multidrug transport system fused ATPase/permease subunit